MLAILESVLSPIILLMEILLSLYVGLFSSIGFSILILSVTFSIALIPLVRLGRSLENRISQKTQKVNAEVTELKGHLKGERLFLATEEVFEKYNYHPIHSVGMSASLLVSLPVLISAVFLFTSDGLLPGQSFLFIGDLSQPDGLFGIINALPLLMFAITFIDARLRFSDDPQSKNRFLIISVILFLLVYNLPSGLILYWVGNNLITFLYVVLRRGR